MCRLEQPSLTVGAEPENVLHAAPPGRCSSWILPSELMTPARPTTGGIQTPTRQPVQNWSQSSYSTMRDLESFSSTSTMGRSRTSTRVWTVWRPVQTGGEHPASPIEEDLFMAHQDELQSARASRPAEAQESSGTSSVMTDVCKV